jgi:hypothetical protein
MAKDTDTINQIAVSVGKIEVTVEELKKAVMGNGKPGLLDRVSCIENQHKNEADNKKESKEKKVKWFDRGWAVAMLFISQMVAWIFLIFRG